MEARQRQEDESERHIAHEDSKIRAECKQNLGGAGPGGPPSDSPTDPFANASANNVSEPLCKTKALQGKVQTRTIMRTEMCFDYVLMLEKCRGLEKVVSQTRNDNAREVVQAKPSRPCAARSASGMKPS